MAVTGQVIVAGDIQRGDDPHHTGSLFGQPGIYREQPGVMVGSCAKLPRATSPA